MRPKVIIMVLLVAVGLLGSLAFLSKFTKRLPLSGTPAEATDTSSNSPAAPIQIAAGVTIEPELPPAPAVVQPQTNRAQYVHQRLEELNALAMNNDSASLETILSELRNPDRQIRKGALEATIQFEDRAAIPRLREIAAETEDEDDKADLLAAADYLNLPSLTEYLAQQQAQREAEGITNSPPIPRTNWSAIRPHAPSPRQRMQAAGAQAQGGQ